ncbi:unnamed protein product, partial [Polarella glacialis]
GVSASLLQMATEIGDVTSGYALLTAVASSIVGGFSYWGFVGGPILTFTYLKPLLFGRNFHTLEYPHGSLRTITVRFVNQNGIRNQIAKQHGLPASEIRHMNVWMEKYFSEAITSPAVRHYLSTATADGSWIVWTREAENIIPTKGLTMGSLGTDEMKLARLRAERVQRYLLKFETAAVSGLQIPDEQMQALLALASQQDPVIMALHAVHSKAAHASAFRCLALLRLQQLDLESASSSTSSSERSEELAAMVRFVGALAEEHQRQQPEKPKDKLEVPRDKTWASLFSPQKEVAPVLLIAASRDQARASSLPYESGVQFTAHVLAGSGTPLALFNRFQLTPAIFVRHAENFLQKKGSVLDTSDDGIFQIALADTGGVL